MDKSQIIFAVCFTSFLLILLISFLLFIFVWQRKKSNSFIIEKESMQRLFREQLLQSQLEMQEQTFNTISQEIHDNVGQTLSLAKVQLNIIDQTQVLDNSLLSDARDSVSKAMADLRDIAKSLNSDRILLLSLPEITSHELHRIDRSGLMESTIHVEGDDRNIQQQKKLIIFRIIQEALQNIIKHSRAKSIRVSFFYEQEYLKTEISDNGIGFNTEQLTKMDGLGLHNMKNRALLIGGEAKISSNSHDGTTITIISPYA